MGDALIWWRHLFTVVRVVPARTVEGEAMAHHRRKRSYKHPKFLSMSWSAVRRDGNAYMKNRQRYHASDHRRIDAAKEQLREHQDKS